MNVSTTVLNGQMTYSMESGASPITLKELHAGKLVKIQRIFVFKKGLAGLLLKLYLLF